MAIKRSNVDVGGRLIEMSETEYMVRGIGYLGTLTDKEMPPHNHDMPQGEQLFAQRAGGNGNIGGGPAHAMKIIRFPATGSKGDGKSYNNMPPYIALYFCKKDEPLNPEISY